MKLTIFAATGGIGRQLLGQALTAGHDAWKGTKAITGAMRAAGVRRIVVVSAAPIGPSPSRPYPPRTSAAASSSRGPTSPTTCSGRSISPRRSGGRSASPANAAVRTLTASTGVTT